MHWSLKPGAGLIGFSIHHYNTVVTTRLRLRAYEAANRGQLNDVCAIPGYSRLSWCIALPASVSCLQRRLNAFTLKDAFSWDVVLPTAALVLLKSAFMHPSVLKAMFGDLALKNLLSSLIFDAMVARIVTLRVRIIKEKVAPNTLAWRTVAAVQSQPSPCACRRSLLTSGSRWLNCSVMAPAGTT